MRYAAAIEYDGTNYHGWQRQKGDLPTVQAHVEQALSAVADEPVAVVCSGRTDAGVHAIEQIIHFDSEAERNERAWIFGTNSQLPHDIAVKWVKPVSHDFHARFSAIARQYRYVIYNCPVRSPHNRFYATWYCQPLDEQKMQQASEALVGEHDFTSFRAKSCQAHSPIRTIEFLKVTREGDCVFIDIKANAFLHHMVRNIAGVLMSIGSGEQPISWVQELLELRSRKEGGVTALPNGLFFVKAFYGCDSFAIETPLLAKIFAV